MRKRDHRGYAALIPATVWVWLLLWPCNLGAQSEPPIQSTGSAGILRSAIASLKGEADRLQEHQEQLNLLQATQSDFDAEINRYKMQASAQASNLLRPQTDIQDLEQGWAEIRAALDTLKTRLKEYSQKLENLNQLQVQAEEQIQLNNQQIAELPSEIGRNSDEKALRQSLKELGSLLANRRNTLDRINQKHAERTQSLTEVHQSYTELAQKFETLIKAQKRQALFYRQPSPLSRLTQKNMITDLGDVRRQVRELLHRSFWIGFIKNEWQTNAFLHTTSAVVLVLALFLLTRTKSWLKRLQQRSFYQTYFWRRLTLRLLHKSMRLLGLIVALQVLISLRPNYAAFPVLRYLVLGLVTILFTRWGITFLKIWQQEDRHPIRIDIRQRLSLLLYTLRYFVIAYLAIAWIGGSANLLLVLARLGFEAFLIIWSLHFWNRFDWRNSKSGGDARSRPEAAWPVLKWVTYVIAVAGPIIELMGYGSLALYWYTSWAFTAVAVFWGGHGFFLLQEWNQTMRQKLEPADDVMVQGGHPIQWLVIRLGWVLWLLLFLVAILLAWGSKRDLPLAIFEMLNQPITIGKIQFSVMNFFYALAVLLITRLVTSLWKYVLNTKILSDSGFETGLKESITTITVYSLWAFGIIVAMQAFGLSAASLAVAFGALGIGLGFGLQNIFNNFISGLILLFERPIQVGDDVEINGVWATVKRINVRATVVQTYDNASLIIPNSEFISAKVTNWSFKDKSLRRNINVGVAYGSDIELVRQTLLDIAQKTEKVRPKPAPDVLFTDFGDSALIFRLRVWTDIENMLKVETAIRFEIDRRFKERGIVIAFPQRDVHLFVDKDAASELENKHIPTG